MDKTSRWAYSPVRSVYRPVRGLFRRRKYRKKRGLALELNVIERQFGKIKVIIFKRYSITGAHHFLRIGRVYKDGPDGISNRFYSSDAYSYAQALWWAIDWLADNDRKSQWHSLFLQCLNEGLAGLDTVKQEFDRRSKKLDKMERA